MVTFFKNLVGEDTIKAAAKITRVMAVATVAFLVASAIPVMVTPMVGLVLVVLVAG